MNEFDSNEFFARKSDAPTKFKFLIKSLGSTKLFVMSVSGIIVIGF